MCKAVFDTRNRNISSLGIVYAKGAVYTMFVDLVLEFLLQYFEIFLQMISEMFQFCGTLFSLYKALPTMPENW